MKISVFGLGYVGTVSAGCLAQDGHTIVGVDPNSTKVAMINAGKTPIVEDQIGELLSAAVSDGRLRATSNPFDAVNATDISVVCVGTPSKQNGSLDLRYVEGVCNEIGAAIAEKSSRHDVVIRSTMLPGSMSETVLPALEGASGKTSGADFGLCNNPEFLREGTAVYDYYNPPKTVIGESRPGDGQFLEAIYESLPGPKIRTDIETAEMVKYVDNVWHALKVGFANEIGSLSKSLGLDGQKIMDIFCQDKKLNLSSYYMKPGFAFGGSCLPKDLRALTYKATRLDVEVPILNSIAVSNQRQIQRGLEMIRDTGARKIGVLGFSFKSGTDDLRESPVVELIERLIGKGYEVSIYDKYVNIARLVGANRDYILNRVPHIARIMAESIDSVLADSELVVVGNGSDEFGDIVDRLKPGQRVLDLCGSARPAEKHDQYSGVGWA